MVGNTPTAPDAPDQGQRVDLPIPAVSPIVFSEQRPNPDVPDERQTSSTQRMTMPITSSFQTETATMTVAARHVDEVANAIDAELRALDNRIQPITSSWRGAAASSYMGLHQRWTEDTRKLRQVLAEISQSLGQNSVRYQTNEDDVAAQMARTAGQL
jgi:WXG100 family type VII secretion target